MAEQFIITTQGQTAIANALANSTTISPKTFKFITPILAINEAYTENSIAPTDIWYSNTITEYDIDANGTTSFNCIVEASLATAKTGTVGLYLDNGTLFAIGAFDSQQPEHQRQGVYLRINSSSATGAFNFNFLSLNDFVHEVEMNAALALKAPLANPTFTGTVGGITKTMVGLGNVDNTTDSLKPISTATQTAITAVDTKVNTEKERIDAILNASTADKDSFAEIVTLINSVDTTNDTAFAGYVISNDAALATKLTASDFSATLENNEIYSLLTTHPNDTILRGYLWNTGGDAAVQAQNCSSIGLPTCTYYWVETIYYLNKNDAALQTFSTHMLSGGERTFTRQRLGTTWQPIREEARPIGDWVNVTASRAVNVTFTNNTGKNIYIMISGDYDNAGGDTLSLTVNNIVLVSPMYISWGRAISTTIFPNDTYLIASSSTPQQYKVMERN